MPHRYRGVIATLVLSLGIVAAPGIAGYPEESDDDPLHESIVPSTQDLVKDAAFAREQNIPLILVFSAEDCDYCKLLEQEILDPMYISRDYDNKAVIRRVMIDSHLGLLDFTGSTIDADAFAKRLGVKVTPTVLFVDTHGKELAPRILGVNTIEMYSAYMDQAIDLSYQEMQNRRTLID